MNQANQNYNSVPGKPGRTGESSSEYSDLWGSDNGSASRHIRSNFMLSDEDLEKIKERIRKRHHSNTTKLLAMYGIILLILIWGLKTYGVF